jgi:hypothetical protein
MEYTCEFCAAETPAALTFKFPIRSKNDGFVFTRYLCDQCVNQIKIRARIRELEVMLDD